MMTACLHTVVQAETGSLALSTVRATSTAAAIECSSWTWGSVLGDAKSLTSPWFPHTTQSQPNTSPNSYSRRAWLRKAEGIQPATFGTKMLPGDAGDGADLV